MITDHDRYFNHLRTFDVAPQEKKPKLF